MEAKNEILQRIKNLREEMKKCGIQYYIIPTSDFHNSEYVNDYFKCREFMSGFTGSNGILLVTVNETYLWTDGRYFIQAAKELEGSEIFLMKMGVEGVPTLLGYLSSNVQQGECIGFDGRVIRCLFGMQLEKLVHDKKCTLKYDVDLVGKLWVDRPVLPSEEIRILSDELTGMSTRDKLKLIRDEMIKYGANFHVLTKLDDLMWLFNIRGKDIPCNPVALCYGIIMEDKAYVYLQAQSVSLSLKQYFEQQEIMVKDYESFYADVKELFGTVEGEARKVLLDKNEINYSLYQLAEGNLKILWKRNPSQMLKAVKNKTELEHMREVYIKDSVAVTRFIYEMKMLKEKDVKKLGTEFLAAQRMDQLRMGIEGFLDLSFDTISAYKENAAMMHYTATEEQCKQLEVEGFLLVDSGGQYLGGTTDVTRTIALGPLSDEERRDFTLVAAGMLRLLNLKFLKGCTGRNLDIIARQPLWQIGKDYKCGTGHGIGYILNVHEGPQRISVGYQKDVEETPFEAGMVVTDEPGVYVEGAYGIRTENVLVCQEAEKNGDGQFLCFENLTWVPIDLDAIDLQYLTVEDKAMLNAYHSQVYNKISPYLNEEEAKWLKVQTREI